MTNEIIKERMLQRLKRSLTEKWWGRHSDRDLLLKDLYLTDLQGQCLPEDYLGEGLNEDIHNKFYWYLDAIRNEFDGFVEIYVIPSYSDETVFFMIYDDKLVYRDGIKAWNFWFTDEESLMDSMFEIYTNAFSKMEKTWIIWILSEEDIYNQLLTKGLLNTNQSIRDILTDNEIEDIADRFKEVFNEDITSWEELLSYCIKEVHDRQS